MATSKATKKTPNAISDIMTLKKETKGTYCFEASTIEGEKPLIGTQFYIGKQCALEGLDKAAAIKITVEIVESK